MSNVIVYQATGGAFAVINPAPGYDLADLAAELVPAGAWQETVDNTALPQGGPENWQLVNNVLTYVAPPPVYRPLSMSQFFGTLALTPTAPGGSTMIITQAEAIAAMAGTMPQELQNLVNQLPSSQQFAATMKILGADSYLIDDPTLVTLSQAFGWSTAQLQAFWLVAQAS